MMLPPHETVVRALRAIAPPGAPQIFREVLSAEMTEDRRNSKVVTAELVIFDGLYGRVTVGRHQIAGIEGWCVEWELSPPCSFEDGEWVRLDEDMKPLLPLFRPRA